MDFLIWHVFPLWLGIAFWELGKYLFRKWRLPYRWRCKRCGFTVEANNRESFEISKSSHNHISTEEYK